MVRNRFRQPWRGLSKRAGALALAGLLAMPFMAMPVAAQQTNQAPADQNQTSANQAMTATVDQIAENPSAYVGKTVTVSGEVEETLGPRSFMIEDNDLLLDEQVLVVGANELKDANGQPLEINMLGDQNVRVTGTVHLFNLRAFEQQLGVDLDDPNFAGLGGRPAIVAQTVVPTGPTAMRGAPGVNPATDVGRFATVNEILDSPSRYYGSRVTVNGEVENVLGPRSFVMEDSDLLFDEQILVVSAEQPQTQLAGIIDGRFLWVTGTVRPFNLASFERDLGVDLDDNRFANWANKPAVVAQSIFDVNAIGVFGPPYPYPYPYGYPYGYAPAAPGAVGRFPRGATVDEITDNPNRYAGQRVTVSGEIEETLGPRSFVIEDSDLLFDEQMPVVSARQPMDNEGRPLDFNTLDGQNVRVSGTVHIFNLAAFEDQLGLDLDDNRFQGWEGKPAIVARSITPFAGRVGAGPAVAQPGSPSNPQAAARNVALDEITAAPNTFYGQTVTVRGQVSEMVGQRSFTIEDSDLVFDDDLLVVNAVQSGQQVQQGQRAEVTGTVRQLNVAEIEQMLGIDLNDQLLAGWAGRPVIIARGVQSPTQQGQ